MKNKKIRKLKVIETEKDNTYFYEVFISLFLSLMMFITSMFFLTVMFFLVFMFSRYPFEWYDFPIIPMILTVLISMVIMLSVEIAKLRTKNKIVEVENA